MWSESGRRTRMRKEVAIMFGVPWGYTPVPQGLPERTIILISDICRLFGSSAERCSISTDGELRYMLIWNVMSYLQCSLILHDALRADDEHLHDVSASLQARQRNQLSETQREKIKSAAKQGVWASNIRMEERLTYSKDVLYAARRRSRSSLESRRWNVWLRKWIHGRDGPT